MTNSFISQVRASLFARGLLDASNTDLERCAAPMKILSQAELKHVAGGDDDSVDGSPKGSWKATSNTTA